MLEVWTWLQPSSPAVNVKALFQFCCDFPGVTQEENLFLNRDLGLGFL